MIYSFWMYDRHCECIYSRDWHRSAAHEDKEDLQKLIYGSVFSLRNITRKLSDDDAFLSFQTSKYKLHFFESPSNLKLVLITDPMMSDACNALRQIYAGLYVEYVVKNPLSPIEHPRGTGVDNDLFNMGLDSFVRSLQGFA
ncbi:Transport protein particle subunit bet5 [Wickerhamiella sorbophila]|uniref:Trafficking protein particle complex subunit n=1 Tax=Wickerhamiella sorbophila TaxID=45607 RepID=A0A2T0FLN3_9ASCO|nr:Transport protein particle subunit bet5 [Wickerhamiella sorbophila]PRT55903.1 Transport protein particle subunit bet5 [Wickerhamiella sorbophila]